MNNNICFSSLYLLLPFLERRLTETLAGESDVKRNDPALLGNGTFLAYFLYFEKIKGGL
jgi:hypothetical protein